MSTPCPFCTLPPERIVAANAVGWVVRDAYPVSPGHTLIIPRRHMGSFFELSADERLGLLALLDEARAALQTSHAPQGYNIGVNDGPAGGGQVIANAFGFTVQAQAARSLGDCLCETGT